MIKSPIGTTSPICVDKLKLIHIGNALVKHGLTPTTADTMQGFFRSVGIMVFVASSQRNTYLRMFDMFVTILKNRADCDIALIDVYSTRNFWYAYLCGSLCRLIGLKYIPILHGGDFPIRMSRSPSAVRTLLRRAHKIVVPSGYLGTALAAEGYSSVMIPNVISVTDYEFTPRTCIKPRLLYVRSFAKLYHPEMALEVLARLTARYQDAALCMVGPDKDGSLPRCRALAKRLGIQDRVRFTGKLSKTEWHALSREYDIFINTTMKDNMPVTVIEAMALGMLVVSTNPGGIPYLIDHGQDGLLVNVGDVDEMVSSIGALIESPNMATELSQRARLKALSFSWDLVFPKWKKLFEL